MKIYLTPILLLFSLSSVFPQSNQSIKFKDKSDLHFRIVTGIGMNQFRRNHLHPVPIIRNSLNSINDYIKPGLKISTGIILEKDLGKKWSLRIGSSIGIRETSYKEMPLRNGVGSAVGYQWTSSINLNGGFNFILLQFENQKLYLIGGGIYNYISFDWGESEIARAPSPNTRSRGLFLFVPHELGLYGGIGMRQKQFSFELISGVTSSSIFSLQTERDNNTFLDFQVGYFFMN